MALHTVAGIQHIGIPTDRLEQTIRFYEALGFARRLETEVPQTGAQVCFLQLADLVLEVYETDAPAGRDGAVDHICLGVSDIEQTWREVQSMGLPVVEEKIQQLPFWENGIRYFNLRGVNQEKIEFCQIL